MSYSYLSDSSGHTNILNANTNINKNNYSVSESSNVTEMVMNQNGYGVKVLNVTQHRSFDSVLLIYDKVDPDIVLFNENLTPCEAIIQLDGRDIGHWNLKPSSRMRLKRNYESKEKFPSGNNIHDYHILFRNQNGIVANFYFRMALR